jgi:hypothetical protein
VKPHRICAALIVVCTLGSPICGATDLTGRIAAGVVVDDPSAVVSQLETAPGLEDDDLVFIGWTTPLDGSADPAIIRGVASSGARAWVRVVFRAPAPVIGHLESLEAELADLVRLARAAGDGVYFQAVWRPDAGTPTAKDHAYLIKRAAVAVTGAAVGASFTAGPLPDDAFLLEELYAEEVAAYLDTLVVARGVGGASAMETLAELDPGKPIVIDALPWPDVGSPLPAFAEGVARGATVVLLDATAMTEPDLTELILSARELSGGLVHDPASDPTGGAGAWAFVREDLGLRVVARKSADDRRLRLVFRDELLQSPEMVDLQTGEARAVTGVRRDGEFVVVVNDAPEVVLLRLERASAAEIEGFDEEIEIGGGRQMPVEEILRRLQAFEDDQDRRLRHFQAKRTMGLRFQGREGSIDVTYAGAYFFRDGTFDWVWSEFYIAGVKWRSRKMPKVPLIQPEKVGSLPVEIRLEKDYEYRLRGTDTVDGRDCWVVDFKPVTAAPGTSRYRGTVWVDRDVYARVRTRAIQVGLEGDVLSNEETYHFSPVDEAGQPAPWSPSSFILPVRISGQQVFSVLNATLPVEIDNRLSEIRINGEAFDADREAALVSDATMLRDTQDGLRYLNKDKSGERVVETEFDSDRLFLVGGVFWDESLDYPVPGAGVNYLDLDFKNTGAQINVFFAGLFLAANVADPDFLGSRWNAGASVNGLFFKTNDELYRDGEVVPEETVRRRSGSFNLFAGRPFAKFFSLELAYRGRYSDYSRADETADAFVLPQNTFTHGLEASVDYNRSGFRVAIAGSVNRRTDWDFWGLPDNTEYSDEQQQFERWQLTFAKTWWFSRFHKIGLVLEHRDSADTDRFSGYDFGIFGDSTVAGYPSGLVRARSLNGAHLNGGINVLELIRLSVGVDAVWADNPATGLDNELLAGIGAGGTVTLPWQLIMNFDVGYAVAGPGKGGVAARVFFLKLFPGS